MQFLKVHLISKLENAGKKYGEVSLKIFLNVAFCHIDTFGAFRNAFYSTGFIAFVVNVIVFYSCF